MKLTIRAPRDHEWQLCRMLLPGTFEDAALREYRLCLREEEPRLVAAMSYRREGDEIKGLQVHVVPGFRRLGVGSHLIAWLSESEPSAMEGMVEVLNHAEAVSFCERNGFERVDGLTTVEMEMAPARAYLRQMRDRLGMPAEARLITLAEAPFDQVAKLHAEEVVHDAELNPWRAVLSQAEKLSRSPVVMVDGEVAGFLLWENDGPLTMVHSRVVAPGYRGGWVLVTMLSEAFDGACEGGGVRARFSFTDTNRDTRRLAQRFEAKTLSVRARYRRVDGGR
ncbi:MAG: GNAT family N-acetyltransferase [Acidobacteriota bacterium]